MVLGLSPGSPVYRFHRIRYADGVADGAGIFHRRRPVLALGASGGGVALRGAGKPPAAARCARCSGCAPCCSPPSRRSCWAIEAGAPGLLIERRGFLHDGRRSSSPSPIIAATPTTSSPSSNCAAEPDGEPHAHVRRSRRGARRRRGAAGAKRAARARARLRACARGRPRAVVTLRARQLGQCRDLRALPARDAARAC